MKSALAALLFLSAASCKKTDDSPAAQPNTWTAGADTYQAAGLQSYSSTGHWTLEAVSDNTGSPAAGISFGFDAMPVAGGSYKIVSALTGSGAELTYSVFKSGASTPDFYVGAGGGTTKAAVSVTGGKVSVTLPEVTAVATGGTSGSIRVSANEISQP